MVLGFLARRLGIDVLRKDVKGDVRSRVEPLKAEVKRLTHQVERLTKQIDQMADRIKELEARRKQTPAPPPPPKQLSRAEIQELLNSLDERQRGHVSRLAEILDDPRQLRAREPGQTGLGQVRAGRNGVRQELRRLPGAVLGDGRHGADIGRTRPKLKRTGYRARPAFR